MSRRARWRPASHSLHQLEGLQPAGNPYGDHVYEADLIGIDQDDRVFRLDEIRVTDLSCWLSPAEWDDIDAERGDGLVDAWRVGPEPPPIIVVRYRDGSLWGLDGWNRLNAAHRAGRSTIPAWVAHENESCPVAGPGTGGPCDR